ncbi:MAG: DNA repair protein RecN [Candidatus Puniceispirillales bacterium]|jgi:DNA repair protein RecN (Recombination protein N)|tara:strand:+ start:156 stop:1826 length:1671 start_codon:yes stop_codon:yes gene_type:complete
MLRELRIKNIVLIEALNIEFKSGLSVLTGETGTGKSILLDSIGLVLGNRSDFNLIRTGESQASVTAIFDFPQSHSIVKTLKKFDINFDDEVIIRRDINKDGKSKCLVNDVLISRNALVEITDQIIEVQGQFEDRGLLNTNTHLTLVDAFAKHEVLLVNTKIAFEEQDNFKKKIYESEIEYNKKLDNELWLRDSLEQLNLIDPKTGEEEEINKKRKIILNQEKIIISTNEIKDIIEQDNGLEDLTNKIFKTLDSIHLVSSSNLLEALEIIKKSTVELEELKNIINNEIFQTTYVSESIENLDDRLHELRTQARKHNCEIDELNNIKITLQKDLNEIDNNKSIINNLQQKYQEAKLQYNNASNLLSESRKKAATILSKEINKELPYLKLENAKFNIEVNNLDRDKFSNQGIDKITFTACTNVGMSMQPINKIASGGELSRFLLAIKCVLETNIHNRTLLFDEIDSGIGGSVANAVGIRLAKLGKAYQTIIITHSPQVSSKGDQHYLIEKNTIDGVTYSRVSELLGKDRIEEIARMLSGNIVTPEARDAAYQLINNSSS